jgi:hypothetical protein
MCFPFSFFVVRPWSLIRPQYGNSFYEKVFEKMGALEVDSTGKLLFYQGVCVLQCCMRYLHARQNVICQSSSES